MRGLRISVTLLFLIVCNNARQVSVKRHQIVESDDPLYLMPAPLILPAPYIDPAPEVLPFGSIDRTGEVEPAGAIEPAPQIQPAPAILPSNAIQDKDRAYPSEKRSGVLQAKTSRQAVPELLVIEHQVSANEIKNHPPQSQNITRKTFAARTNQETRGQQKKPNHYLTKKQLKVYKSKQNGFIYEKNEVKNKRNEGLVKSSYKRDGRKSSRTTLSEQEKHDGRMNKNVSNFASTMTSRSHANDTVTSGFIKGLTNGKITKVKVRRKSLKGLKGSSKHQLYRGLKSSRISNYRILKKNGAKLVLAKIFSPTPYHLTLNNKKKTSTSPTKKTRPTKCQPTKKPSAQESARLIPTQTNFIKNAPNNTKPNKAPMQKPITTPTKKVAAKVIAGCSMEAENVAPKQPSQSIVVQTLSIPTSPKRNKTSGKLEEKYKTKQTFHIKQMHDLSRNWEARHLTTSNAVDEKDKSNTNIGYAALKNLAVFTKKIKKQRMRHAYFRKRSTKFRKKSLSSVAKTRIRRQLMLPFGLSNEQQPNPYAQQLLSSIPVQQMISNPQQLLGQMISTGGQPAPALLPQPNLFSKQALYSPLLEQQALSSPFILAPQQAIQAVQPQFALSPPQMNQNGFPLSPVLSNPAFQNSPISYLSPQSKGLASFQPSSSQTGQAREEIPEVAEYTEEDEYPYVGKQRPNHRRGSRRRSRTRKYPFEYDTYRSFEDTYGKSPGIFDDLKDISSEMGSYIDGSRYHPSQKEWVENEDEERHRYADDEPEYHHSRHRTSPHDIGYQDYKSEERNQAEEDVRPVSDNGEQEFASPEIQEEGTTKGTVHNPADISERFPVFDPREESSLHDAEESTKKAVKETNLPHDNVQRTRTDLAIKENEESQETQSKRSESVIKLDNDAVMHLDFDETAAKKDIVKDISNNSNDATLSNGATMTAKSLGTCGRGVILKKGELSYNGMSFKRKPTKEVSIAMWVKSKKPGFIRWFDQDGAPNKGFFASTKGAAVTKNRWTHLVGTFDTKTGVARIYVNGKLKLEKIGKKNNGLPQDFTSTGIGRKFGDSHVTFLDDVYMFDRVITPEEVKALHTKCEFNRMVLHYGFQHWNGTTKRLDDQSGLQNNGTLEGGANVRASGCDKCGACLALQSDNAEVYLNSSKYHQKPKFAVSISSWINLNRTKGLHSIFQALDHNKNNVYNLEVTDGKVHWQSKDKNGEIIFDALTNEVTIPEGLWSHVTGTYSAKSGDAKIYVNGLLRASFHNPGGPSLSTAWSRASIGGHFPDRKPFGGLLDEFFMYNWELDGSEVGFVSKYCADKPKLVSFTVKVPIL